jgi:DNA-binding NarL/FixJ family response regulator
VSGVRVFLVAATAAELSSLRAAAAKAGLDIVGDALSEQLDSGAATIPSGVDAVMTTPQRPTASSVTPTLDRREGRERLVEPLTPRERTVLALVADGLGNRAIGQELDISEHTVKFHLASIFGKLGVASRTEAVRRGLRLGLIEI